jgi:hypothetical protein
MRSYNPAETDGQSLFVKIAVPGAPGAIWAVTTQSAGLGMKIRATPKVRFQVHRAAFLGQAPRLRPGSQEYHRRTSYGQVTCNHGHGTCKFSLEQVSVLCPWHKEKSVLHIGHVNGRCRQSDFAALQLVTHSNAYDTIIE